MCHGPGPSHASLTLKYQDQLYMTAADLPSAVDSAAVSGVEPASLVCRWIVHADGDVMARTDIAAVESVEDLPALREVREVDPSDGDSPEKAPEVPEDYYFGRFGTFMLIAS